MIYFVALVFLAGVVALLRCSYLAAGIFKEIGCWWLGKDLVASLVYGLLTLLPLLIVVMAVLCLVGISRGEI